MAFRSVMGFVTVAALALMAEPSLAQQDQAEALADPDATAQGDVAVTIYNSSDALVQDIRQINIPAGRTTITFPDVSARIRAETLSFAAADAGIIEQNFDFDLLTPQKLMEKAIGQTVTLLRTNPATGAETRERATVLSTVGGVIIKIGDRIEVLRDDGLPVRVIFDRVPTNLRARPTLSVNVESSRAGTRAAAIRYLTPGLGWSADYVALYDEAKGTIDMQGWVTLTNQTGTTFHDADTLLVAGDPENSGSYRPQPRGRYAPPPPPGSFVPGTETADRERLGDFYLYPIAERTTIANNQTKQVSFMDVQAVPAQKIYRRYVSWLGTDGRPVNVGSEIAFSSSSQGGLGDALPAGTVRFYQRDRKGTPQFIGENEIDHTPMGSSLSLITGDAFDIFVQAEVVGREEISSDEYRKTARYRVVRDGEVIEQVEVERNLTFYRTTMRYTVTSAAPAPVQVEVVQQGLDRGYYTRDFRVVSESLPGEQQGLSERKYTVPVPANGKTVVEVTYETKF